MNENQWIMVNAWIIMTGKLASKYKCVAWYICEVIQREHPTTFSTDVKTTQNDPKTDGQSTDSNLKQLTTLSINVQLSSIIRILLPSIPHL